LLTLYTFLFFFSPVPFQISERNREHARQSRLRKKAKAQEQSMMTAEPKIAEETEPTSEQKSLVDDNVSLDEDEASRR
jgi:hypothetical protein